MGSRSWHSSAFQFRSSAIRPLLKDGLKSWELTSYSNKYTIEEIKIEKDHKCSRKCRTCKVCFHMYSCTCPDYAKGNTLCKHIHACILNMDNKLDVATPYSSPRPYVNPYSHYYDDDDDSVDSDEDKYGDWYHGVNTPRIDPETANSDRHDRGLDFDPLTIHIATPPGVSLESWNVISARDESITYAVREVSNDCVEYDECRRKCPACNACKHMFTCTCPDYDNNFMCKHIHACIIFFEIGSRCENISKAENTTVKNADLIELLNNCKHLIAKTVYKNDTECKLKNELKKILQMASKFDYSQPADSKKNMTSVDSKKNLKLVDFEVNSIPDVNATSSLKREILSADDVGAPKRVKLENEIFSNSSPCTIIQTESTD